MVYFYLLRTDWRKVSLVWHERAIWGVEGLLGCCARGVGFFGMIGVVGRALEFSYGWGGVFGWA